MKHHYEQWQVSSATQKESVPMKTFISQNDLKQRITIYMEKKLSYH